MLTDDVASLRVFADVNARMISRPESGEEPLTLAAIRQAKADDLLWGMVIAAPARCESGAYGPGLRDVLLHPELAGFAEMRRLPSGALVLK